MKAISTAKFFGKLISASFPQIIIKHFEAKFGRDNVHSDSEQTIVPDKSEGSVQVGGNHE